MTGPVLTGGPAPHPQEPRAEGGVRPHHRQPALVQLARFALVGGAGTAFNAGLFLLLRNWFDAVPANLVALLVSTALTTELHRRFTFGGATGHRWRAGVQDVGTVVFYACYSSLVLLAVQALVPGVTQWGEALAVAAASVAGGLTRFAVLRFWVFTPHAP